jgi:hypothetical protein
MVGARRQVKPGERYRALRSNGSPSPIVWEVVEIVRTSGGIEHARLEKVDDRTETRTLACSVIADRRQFRREN